MLLPLSDIAEIGLGAATHGRSAVGIGDKTVPMASIRHIRAGYIDVSDLDHTAVDHLSKIERYQVRKNDIVVTIRGSLFRAAIVEAEQSGLLISGNVAYIRLKPGAPISSLLVMAWLNSPSGVAKATALQTGAAILTISTRDLKGLSVPIPPQSVQAQLEETIKAHQEWLRASERAQALRDQIFNQTINRIFYDAENDIQKGTRVA